MQAIIGTCMVLDVPQRTKRTYGSLSSCIRSFFFALFVAQNCGSQTTYTYIHRNPTPFTSIHAHRLVLLPSPAYTLGCISPA